jgi:DOPA 4,5-dioxygenase
MDQSSIVIQGYHAHIYFDEQSRAEAVLFHQLLGDQLGSHLRYYGRLIDRPIGPHPTPMFEIDFQPEHFQKVVNFLMLNHGALSVLIHPETGEDIRDHSTLALWLGKQLDLDFDFLRQFGLKN